MEHNSHMATLSEGGSRGLNVELMARRLKNRERQRRYRAKKRFEADMKKSYMMQQQQMMWPVEPQSHMIVDTSESSEALVPAETQASDASTCSVTRVYSGRKWKEEARLARPSEAAGSLPARLLPEVDTDPECPASANIRRDWKADARRKSGVLACESIH